jgi:hypothetical protein
MDQGLRGRVSLQRTMRLGLSKKTKHELIAGILLFAFAVRALVPQGFMPASDRPFSIEICPEGFPAQLLVDAGHHHHSGNHWHIEHCVFGSGCTSGPVSHLPSLVSISLVRYVPPALFVSAAIAVQLVHLPQARGPPAAA